MIMASVDQQFRESLDEWFWLWVTYIMVGGCGWNKNKGIGE